VELIGVEQELFECSVVADYIVWERGQILMPLVYGFDVPIASGKWYTFEHFTSSVFVSYLVSWLVLLVCFNSFEMP